MIAIPVYVREQKNYELLQKCLTQLSFDKRVELFINAWDIKNDNLEALGYGTHYRKVNSVAGAWNDAVELSYKIGEICVIINQDIELKEELFTTKTITAAKTKQGEPDFALFAVNPEFIKEKFGTLRPFDEGFEGAYFEDNDFRYQCKLKGIDIELVDLDFEHYGSGVLKHDKEAAKENEQRFRKNHIRYINKWGGIRGQETFKTAFNK